MVDLDFNAVLGTLPPQLRGQLQAHPEIQDTLQTGLNYAGDATPALSLIGDLASGKAVTPQSAIMAMAGVAAAVNPIAGAVVLTMGTALNALTDATNDVFRQLGLQHIVPQPSLVIGGIGIGIDNIPKGPTPDPNNPGKLLFSKEWKNWDWLIQQNTTGGGIIQGLPNFLRQIQYSFGGAKFGPDAKPMTRLVTALAGRAHWYKWQNPDGVPDLSTPKNDFERFFYELLKRDIEYWWNAQDYIHPRDLLDNAIKVWNGDVKGSGGAVHQPSDHDAIYMPGRDSIPAFILDPMTDVAGALSEGELATPAVHLGPAVTGPPNPPPGHEVTTIHVPLDIGVQTIHALGPKVPSTPENIAFAAVFQKYKAQGMTDDAALDAASKEIAVSKLDLASISAKAVANAVNNARVIVAKPVKPGWSTTKKVVVVSALAAALALVARAKG